MGAWSAMRSAFGAKRPEPRTHAEVLAYTGQTALTFKDAESALAYTCKFMAAEMEIGATLPAIIDSIDQIPPFGVAARVRICAAGEPRLATAVMPINADDFVGRLRYAGKLCLVLIGPVVPLAGDERAMVVIAILEPRWTSDGWLVSQRFSPA